MTEPIEISELGRLEQRFISRAKALTLLRLCLLAMAQVFCPSPKWAVLIVAGIGLSYWLTQNKKWGRIFVFLSLNLDLIWQTYAISQTGFFHSPLAGILPANTLLFALLFHQPLIILPPLMLLPVLTFLDPDVPVKILALYSLLNACTIYLTNRILGEEEATSYKIWKLEQALKKQAVIEERHRISRDIHDGVGSALAALILQADQAEQPEIKELAQEALQETRYAISLMREELDLKSQIKSCAELFSKRYDIKTDLMLDSTISGLSDKKALAVLRILQESLTNIAKHADASNVEIRASMEQNRFLLHIKDDGVGFDTQNIPKNHYGIRNIEERVRQMDGTVKITSASNLGTQIQIGASL